MHSQPLSWLQRAVLLILLGPTLAWAASGIDHLEPPFWWAGMRHTQLQLMLHGQDLARFEPEIDALGVRIESVQRVANHNYLFINLALAADLAPGPVELRLRRGQELLRQTYEFRARQSGSAERRGFDASDVILNLVPDRFANGSAGNDSLPGYADKLDRGNDSAGRHGGDIQGITDHLDYIAEMGYTMLWPTPMLENRQATYSYHGYAITDCYRIDPRLGSNESYLGLVQAAKQRGIGVIQDMVLNHIGSGHWWLADLPSPDWLSYDGRFVPTQHYRTAVADPYASAEDRLNFTAGWFDVHMPDMNQRNPLVATYQIQNTLWWVEYAGLSGLRIDTYGYNDRRFLTEWSRRVTQEYPRLNIVGEEWSPNPVVIAQWLRGRHNSDGYVSYLPSVMDFPLHETLRRALLGPEGLHHGFYDLYSAMVNDTLYPEPMNLVLFEGNHDVPRLYSVLGRDLGLTKIALAYVLTMRGIPQLYYGTEVLMESPTERDDGATRRDFPGGWPGDSRNAFTGQGLTPDQLEMQGYLRQLMNWRKSSVAVHQGRLRHYTPDRGTYTYFRDAGASKVMVVLNKSLEPVVLDTHRFAENLPAGARGRDVISGQIHDLARTLTVAPRSALVLDLL
jgi:glycosidase